MKSIKRLAAFYLEWAAIDPLTFIAYLFGAALVVFGVISLL